MSAKFPRGGGGGEQDLFSSKSICFDMQHDHILNKLNFNLLTPTPGSGASASKIYATILLHASFPLIRFATLPYF